MTASLIKMTDPAERPTLLTRAELARLIGVSVRTLENWEKQRFGPRPVRIGRSVRYQSFEVDEFLSSLNPVAVAASF